MYIELFSLVCFLIGFVFGLGWGGGSFRWSLVLSPIFCGCHVYILKLWGFFFYLSCCCWFLTSFGGFWGVQVVIWGPALMGGSHYPRFYIEMVLKGRTGMLDH